MNDTSAYITEMRDILSEKILPWVAAKDDLRMILARRPLRLPPNIRSRRQPAPVLEVNGKFKSSWFLAQDKKEAMHALRFPYLCYVVEGEIDMRLAIPPRGGEQQDKSAAPNSYEIITLPKNTFLLIPPGVFYPESMHWERAPQQPVDSRVFWLHILPTGAYCHTCTTRKTVHTTDDYGIIVPDLHLATLTEFLVDELQSSDANFAVSASSALLLLLNRVRRGLDGSSIVDKGRARINRSSPLENSDADAVNPSAQSGIVERACAYIRTQRGNPIGVKDIASHVYVSPSHLAKLFRTTLQTTVMKYLLDQRMEAARSMLVNSEVSIKEIARFIGYMQPPQFNRIFKQVHHVSPMEFRKQQRHRKHYL